MTVFDFVIGTLNGNISRSLESRILQLCAQIEDNLIILKDDDHKLSIQGSLSTLSCLEAKIGLLMTKSPVEENPDENDDLEGVAVKRTVTGIEAKGLGVLDRKSSINQRNEKAPSMQCEYCSFKTNRQSHLEKHLKKHESNDSLVTCDLCPYTCIRYPDLAKHRKNAHGSSSKIGLECNMCEFKTAASKSLEMHKVTRHVLPEKVSLFECTKCDYKTLKSSLMTRHLSKHAVKPSKPCKGSIKRLSCDQCNYSTSKIGNLSRHKLTHSDIRKHLCGTCGLNFKRSDTLKQHLAIHAQEGGELVKLDFPSCNICGKICRSSNHLEEHMANHTNERNFLCHLCGAAFKTKAMQHKHIKSIHKKTVITNAAAIALCNSIEDINDHVDDEDEDDEPVIYTLDLTQESNDALESNLHAYLINESGALILSKNTDLSSLDFSTK